MKEKVFLGKVSAIQKVEALKERFVSRVLKNNSGEFVETLIKILIGVVVGGIVLTLIVALIQNMFPEIEARLMELFNFDGTGGGGGTPAVTT